MLAPGERSSAFDLSAPLREVCECNGLSQSAFAEGGHEVDHLDLFLGTVADLSWARLFPGLKSLCAMKQLHLSDLTGLEHCPLLERLWATECQLQGVEGLEGSRALKELYLSGNRIRDLGSGLGSLSSLTTLWLCENRIVELRGFEALGCLRVLWLCGNEVDTVGGGLRHNTQLEELNLASNQVSSLRDLLHLQRLPALRRLSLSDPHFGANPVCALCNYQTFVVHHLPALEALDGEAVAPRAKELAAAIFTKKEMYYQMRCKTLRRSSSNVAHKAAELLARASAPLREGLTNLAAAAKDLEAGIAYLPPAAAAAAAAGEKPQLEDGGGVGGEEEEADEERGEGALAAAAAAATRCGGALAAVRRRAAAAEARLGRMAAAAEDLRRRADGEVCAFSTARVMLEFETGGNGRRRRRWW